MFGKWGVDLGMVVCLFFLASGIFLSISKKLDFICGFQCVLLN